MRAIIEGQSYDIPEMWLVGREQAGDTYEEAIRYWHLQAQIEKRYREAAAVEARASEAIARGVHPTIAERNARHPTLVGKTLRCFSAAGPCLTHNYGVIVSYTDKTVTYRREDGKIKRLGGYYWHSNGTRPLGEGLLHCEPCVSCTDHKLTQYPNGYMD